MLSVALFHQYGFSVRDRPTSIDLFPRKLLDVFLSLTSSVFSVLGRGLNSLLLHAFYKCPIGWHLRHSFPVESQALAIFMVIRSSAFVASLVLALGHFWRCSLLLV